MVTPTQHDASNTMTARDRMTSIAVAVSAVIAVICAFVGSGAAGGTPIAEAAGGALSADATPVAPGGPAFSIWSVIYLGLLAYAVWQLFPARGGEERRRRVRPWAIASLLLNGAWILCVQFDLLALTVPVIAALLGVLVRLFLIVVDAEPVSRIDVVVTDGTFGLYLGWVTAATAANTAAALTASGFNGFGLPADTWGSIVAVVAGIAGALTAVRGRGRVAPALGLIWGLAWIAVARIQGPLIAEATAAAAVAAALAVAGVAIIARIRGMRIARASVG